MRKVGQRENESFNREKMQSGVSLAHKIHGIKPSGPFMQGRFRGNK